MLPLAVGVLGLTPADLDVLEPSELRRCLAARYAYDERRERSEWERTRILAWFTAAPHFKKGANKQPKDLIPLPWDNAGAEPDARPRSLDELRAYYAEDLKRMRDGE